MAAHCFVYREHTYQICGWILLVLASCMRKPMKRCRVKLFIEKSARLLTSLCQAPLKWDNTFYLLCVLASPFKVFEFDSKVFFLFCLLHPSWRILCNFSMTLQELRDPAMKLIQAIDPLTLCHTCDHQTDELSYAGRPLARRHVHVGSDSSSYLHTERLIFFKAGRLSFHENVPETLSATS